MDPSVFTSIKLKHKREQHRRESFGIFVIQHKYGVLFNILADKKDSKDLLLLIYANKFCVYIFWSEEVSASPVFSI